MGEGTSRKREHLMIEGVSASSPPDLHIIVPVYNEAENFPAFYDSIRRHVHVRHLLLVIYDSLSDSTLPVARQISALDSTVLLVRNQGQGVLAALKTGLAYPGGTCVVVTMADGSDDHSRVDQMYESFQRGYHLVSATRYGLGGKQLGGPIVKRWMSRVAGLSLHLLGGLPTSDPTNNFKLYSKAFLSRVTIESQGGFELALELTAKAHRMGFTIAEVPTTWTDRVAGKSNFKMLKWLPFYLRWYVFALTGIGRKT